MGGSSKIGAREDTFQWLALGLLIDNGSLSHYLKVVETEIKNILIKAIFVGRSKWNAW